MSVRTRTAAAMLLASLAINTPALAQGVNGQLTAEEQVAAQNFNGIDICGDSLGSPTGSSSNGASGQGFNSNNNGAFNNSLSQNGLYTNLNSQNTQLGQGNSFGNGAINNGSSNAMSSMNGINSMNTMNGSAQMNVMNGMSNMNSGMFNGSNDGMNNMSNGMTPQNSMNNMAGGMVQNNGMNSNSGGIAQTIGNTLMNDPQMMQRAVGVAGAAALFGLFVGNGGVGGMMRAAGMDNTRHIRGSVVGY
jgi:hypothetical protein